MYKRNSRNNDKKLKYDLSKYNCKFFETKTHRFDVQLQRYAIYLRLLKKEKFNKILCCDCRDIYFQSNPFNFDYKGEINFFLEDKKINLLDVEFINNKNFHFYANGLIFGKTLNDEYKVCVKGGYMIIKKIEVNGEEILQKKILRLGKFLK